MKFEWDLAKAGRNLEKHGISFDEAIEIFADADLALVKATREIDREERSKAIGRIGDRLFTVIFTQRGGARRLISARRANRKKEQIYDDYSPDA